MSSKIKCANDKLDELFKSSTYDDNTQAAITYFVGNKDRLKYLLTAYKIKDRYSILLRHLNNQFANCNENMLKPILAKHGIHDDCADKYFYRMILYIVIPLFIIIFISMVQSIGEVALLICTFGGMALSFFIWIIISVTVDTSCRPLFMKSEYRKMGTPKRRLI